MLNTSKFICPLTIVFNTQLVSFDKLKWYLIQVDKIQECYNSGLNTPEIPTSLYIISSLPELKKHWRKYRKHLSRKTTDNSNNNVENDSKINNHEGVNFQIILHNITEIEKRKKEIFSQGPGI